MTKKIILDSYEKDIESNIEKQSSLNNMSQELKMLRDTAKAHSVNKKSITLRIHERDLEAMKIKAARTGVPYQTYINMIIHRDATSM